MGSVRRDTEMLMAVQAALDTHENQCGDPVVGILLNPLDWMDLDWPDFGGIPILHDEDLDQGRVRIDCLRTTVARAIAEVRDAMAESDIALREAEERLEAKLETLNRLKKDWWETTRDPDWWKQVAADSSPDEDPSNDLIAFLDAWMEQAGSPGGLDDDLNPEAANPPVEPKPDPADFPNWLGDDLDRFRADRALRPYDQERDVLRRKRPGLKRRLRALFRMNKRERP